VASQHLQGCNPCLCQLRTDGLAPASKYLTYQSHASDMGPVNLVVGCRQRVALPPPPTTSMASSREKLGTDPRIGQLACCGLCQEPFFSGAVALSITIEDFAKGCHVRGLPTGNIHRAYMDWRGKRTWRVGRIFPYREYIYSNRRDSQI
jgi:hypothetical protein